MVLAQASRHGDAEQLLEEQDHVPVELGGALDVAALPGLLHQHRHGPAGHEALSLQISLVAYDQDGHLAAAAFPARARDTLRQGLMSDTAVGVLADGGARASCVRAVPPCFGGAGVDWRIRAHRLKGPPTTHCSGWFMALNVWHVSTNCQQPDWW